MNPPMLDQTDIDRVSAYLSEGFPELKSRFHARVVATPKTDNLDDRGTLGVLLGPETLVSAPQGLAKIWTMFLLAKVFAQATQDVVDRKSQNLCDAVATACVMSLEGRGAKHALSVVRDNRLEAGRTDELQDTGVLMLHLLGDKGFPAKMNAKEALEHAERLYDRMYPAVNSPQTAELTL